MTTTPLTSLTGNYTIDPAHTQIGFVARHAMVTKVRGAFNEFEGTGYFDGEDPAKSTVSVTIKAASIDTRNEQRDGHLRTNDFLDAPNYPDITFASTGVQQLDGSNFRLTGDLTIKDATRPLSIDFEFQGSATDPYGNLRVGFEGSAPISRKEYGITWNAALEGGGVLVGDKVVLEFEVSAIRQP
ncbi:MULTISPECIES: YceI family protein [unclassified Streptomyces]|uniref:YceI family protein n=1 Tax=unclassified Streptomyces TaxID=2593676 RepID=UPI000DC7DB87|nr:MULTISPECIES: YceI family protein [unclassified Streptomyces]AWZ09750.1 polyisoprenoid-binding protein [Streptomyces sp. ICC4]AWZ17421.1 polyisoprenoid-binding protein [Streptomyces sp. ICC1]